MGNWRKRKLESVVGVTEYPAGPNLAALAAIGRQKIYVTTSGYDDIGRVLTAIGVDYEPFAGTYDCDLFFLNCGTSDTVNASSLRKFVESGGCLYASDLTSSIVTEAFPGSFTFGGNGTSGTVKAEVVDPELREVIGPRVDVHFDMPAWSVLAACTGDTLVRASSGTAYSRKPFMVEIDIGRGTVFYTCFHNRAQTSEKESALLKLLVLKQIGASTHRSVAQVSKSLGINLMALKKP